MELLQLKTYYALFRTFARTAFHLEMQDSYHTQDEAGPFQLFLTQRDDDFAWHQPWLNLVRNVMATGNTIKRARVVTILHVDYTRWGLRLLPITSLPGKIFGGFPGI
jgi:hypothetical protein